MLEGLQDHPAWVLTLTIALLSALGALVLNSILRAVLRGAARRSAILRHVLAKVQHPAVFLWPLLAMQLVWEGAPDTLVHIAGVRHWTGVLLIVAVTAFVMRAISGLAEGLIEHNPANVEDNLHARRVQTQTRVLARSAMVLVLLGGAAMVLMTFPGARQVGASLLASAGVLGVVGGLAARPVFSNLIAGLQLALAQPLRIDDALLVEGEFGRVEEINGTYVVLKLWDERRMIVPLQYFIEKPFQNWTRTGAQLHQSVILHVDYGTPIEPLRSELKRIVQSAPEWDRRTASLVVVDSTERSLKVRALVSARSSGLAFDLGCKVREGLVAFLARDYPECLPRVRGELPLLQLEEESA